jgi:septal ring factor EnvC (AmiA/AmiB activator)
MGKVIENSDRGLTINKGLAWTIVTALVAAGVWVGTQTATMSSGIDDLSDELDKLSAQISSEAGKRDQLAIRVRNLENKNAARDANYSHFSKRMQDVQTQLSENNRLLRELLQRAQMIPTR